MHRAYISSQRLLSWLSAARHLATVSDAVEKDWICIVFMRPSFDISAHHTTSRCSHDELLRAFSDAKQDTV